MKLNSNSDSIDHLMSYDSPAKIRIDTAILRVLNVQLLPAISNELNQTIAHHNAKFLIRRVEMKTFTISSGTRSKIEYHLHTGQLPKLDFIGLVTNKAFNGTLDTYPFFFQHFNLSKRMSLVMDIVSLENHLNLDLKMISISDLSYQFTKQ